MKIEIVFHACAKEAFVVVCNSRGWNQKICLAIDFTMVQAAVNLAVIGNVTCKLVFPLASSKSVFAVLFDSTYYYVKFFVSFLTFSFTLDPNTVIIDRIAAEPNNQYAPPIMETGMELFSLVTGGLIAV